MSIAQNIKIIRQNLFDCDADAYLHQVNAHGIWGSGVAKEMKKRYPRSWESDKLVLLHDPKKLGTFSFSAPDAKQDRWIFSVCGQFNFGRHKQYTDYSALLLGLESVRDFLRKMEFSNFSIAMPLKIGAELLY